MVNNNPEKEPLKKNSQIAILILGFSCIIAGGCNQSNNSGQQKAAEISLYSKPVEPMTTLDTTNWKILAKDNYTIHYPVDWEININTNPSTVFMLISPMDSIAHSRAGISLAIGDETQDTGIDVFAKGAEEETKKLYTNVNLFESKRISVGKTTYTRMLFTLERNDEKYIEELWFRIVDKKTYVLHFLTYASTFDKYKKSAETALGSFTLN
jgi:hypothetical protein